MSTAPQVMLRPLNIGEIFDRAITIYIQNFVIFSLMLLTVLVPIGVATYAFQGDQVSQFTQAFDAIQHPGGAAARRAAANPFPYSGAQLAGLAAFLLLAVFVAPVATNSVALGVAALYRGRRLDFAECFGQAFRDWPRLIGTIFVMGAALTGAYIAGVIGLSIFVAVGVAFVKVALPLAIVVFVIAGLAFIALLLALVVLIMAAYFAVFAVSIERSKVFAAVGSGFLRIFSGAEFKRAILMSLAYGALQMGASSIAAVIGIALLLLFKAAALQVGVSTIINAVLSGFGTTLIAVYYYDVRVRREAYDLEADLERLGTATTA